MKYHNQLPPNYKSHLAFLVDNWGFIQALNREDLSVQPLIHDSLTEADSFTFDIQYLKAKAMEEMMELLPSPAFATDVLHVVRNGVEFSNIKDYKNHPAWTLAYGLFEKLAARR